MSSTSLYPTTSATEMLLGAADFVKAEPIFTSSFGMKPGHQDFMSWLPSWMEGIGQVRATAGVTLESWADYTLEDLKKKVPADLKIELEPFQDLGSVSRQVIISSWLRKADRFKENGRDPITIRGKWKGFKHLSNMNGLYEPQVQGFELSSGFQTPVFRLPVKEGGYILLAQHNSPLEGADIYKAAETMWNATKVVNRWVQTDSLTVPVTDVEVRGRLPWMEGITFGNYRLAFAHYYAHLQMDELGSKDVQEVQGGFEKFTAVIQKRDFVIDGSMVYVRVIGETIVAPYYLGEDAYLKA